MAYLRAFNYTAYILLLYCLYSIINIQCNFWASWNVPCRVYFIFYFYPLFWFRCYILRLENILILNDWVRTNTLISVHSTIYNGAIWNTICLSIHLVLRVKYPEKTKSTPWLLMPWLPASPDQEAWLSIRSILSVCNKWYLSSISWDI